MTPVIKFGTGKRAYGRYEKMLAKDSLNVERSGAVVKPRIWGRDVPGSSPPVAVRCGLEQVTYRQLLR